MKTSRVEILGYNELVKGNCISIILTCMVILSGMAAVIPSVVDADGGWVPYFADFSIYEPGQKAIIAWNGEEEILIISVDVYGAGPNKALHMVPLPSMPTIQLGNVSAFQTINSIIFNRGYFSDEGSDGTGEAEGESEAEGNGVKIEFHDRIGPHNLTIVSVKNSTHFLNWIKNFLISEGVENITLPEDINDVIDHYLNEDINYFAFDVIDINKTEYSVQPIIYRFNSDYLYYPLVISSLIEGSSDINVVTLTPDDLPIEASDFSELGFSRHFGFKISQSELETISPEISELITTDAYLSFYKDLFPLNELNIDVKSKVMDNVNWFESVYQEINEPIYYDCNGDYIEDIVFYTEGLEDINYESVRGRSTAGYLQEPYIGALDSIDGSLLWKFNVTKPDNSSYQFLELIDMELLDVNLDGKMEVLAFFGIRTRYNEGYGWRERNYLRLCALDVLTGDQLWVAWIPQDYYYYYSYYSHLQPKIGDIDSDGKLEIVFYSGGSDWTSLHAYNLNNGTMLWKHVICDDAWEGLLDFIIFDITQDLNHEIIYRTEEKITVLYGKTGKKMWSKKLNYNEYSESLNFALLETIHDFDLDGNLEIFIVSSDEDLYLLNGMVGTTVWSQDLSASRGTTNQGWKGGSSVAFNDIDSDGILEIFYFWLDGVVALESNNGTVLWKNLAIVPQGEPYYDWYYYSYYNIDDYWRFEVCDIDIDDNLEIIYYHGQEIYALESETGKVIWYKTLYSQYGYSIIFDFSVYDINKNGISDIIVAIEDDLYVLKGADGSIIWKNDYNEDYPIHFTLTDINSDFTSEILVECERSIQLLNLENGNIEWIFNKRNLDQIEYYGLADFDSDSDFEILLADKNGLYVLNPFTGNLIWDFTMGDRLIQYHCQYSNSIDFKNLLILSDDRIYSINKQQMYCALNVNPASGQSGDIVTIRMYLGYYDTPLSGVEIGTSDYGLAGTFSDIEELYPGVYQFNYKIPETNESKINISLDAYHPQHYGLTEVVQIEIIDNVTESAKDDDNLNKAKKLLTIYASAIPDTLKPGETTTIIFKVQSGPTVFVSDLNITLFDGFMNGSFSSVERYSSSSEYLTFRYTVNKTITTKSIPILILASHLNYHDGICILNLNITNVSSESTTEPQLESGQSEENLTINKLSVLITAYPEFLMPGSETAIMVYITAGDMEITNAKLQPFDNSLGGTISEVVDYGGGHYSFIYSLPSDIFEQVSNAIIILYISHDDYLSQLEIIELQIIREEKPSESINLSDLKLNLLANPTHINPGKEISIVISILDETSKLSLIDLSKLKIEITDNGKGGTFSQVEGHDLERIVYNYISSKLTDSTIEITAILYYENQEITSEKLELEVVPVQEENELSSDDDNDSDNDYLLMFLPLFIFIVVFGVSFGIFSRIKPRTRKK